MPGTSLDLYYLKEASRQLNFYPMLTALTALTHTHTHTQL